MIVNLATAAGFFIRQTERYCIDLALDWQQVMSDRLQLKQYHSDRYDIAWIFNKIPGNYILILRHDSSLISSEL